MVLVKVVEVEDVVRLDRSLVITQQLLELQQPPVAFAMRAVKLNSRSFKTRNAIYTRWNTWKEHEHCLKDCRSDTNCSSQTILNSWSLIIETTQAAQTTRANIHDLNHMFTMSALLAPLVHHLLFKRCSFQYAIQYWLVSLVSGSLCKRIIVIRQSCIKRKGLSRMYEAL